MVSTVVAAAVPPAPSLALQLIEYEPDCAKLGVPVSVRLGFDDGPADAGPARNAALFVCESVTAWASGSEAEPVIETAAFSAPLTVAGAAMVGFRFTLV